MKKTVVIGASPDPARYSNMAVRLLKQYGHEVVPIGTRRGNIEDLEIVNNLPQISDTETVTLYLNSERQLPMYEFIFGLKPKRIIFNPGTENPDFWQKAAEKGIETVEACTLVMLRTNQY
jgi:predicted CoA-binding protein